MRSGLREGEAKKQLPRTRSGLMKSTVALMILAPLISGCETANFDARGCPQERNYTREEQAAIADQLKLAGPAVKSAMVDYGKLRDKARACRGVKR